MSILDKLKYWILQKLFGRKYIISVDIDTNINKSTYLIIRYKKGGELIVEREIQNCSEHYDLPKDFLS